MQPTAQVKTVTTITVSQQLLLLLLLPLPPPPPPPLFENPQEEVATTAIITTTATTSTSSCCCCATTSTTEYLQWCIIWTLAYPCIASKLLSSSSWNQKETNSSRCCSCSNCSNSNCNHGTIIDPYDNQIKNGKNDDTDFDTDLKCIGHTSTTAKTTTFPKEDDFLWQSYISFHCIWNHYSVKMLTDHKKSTTTTNTNSNDDKTSDGGGCISIFKWRHSLGYGEISETAIFHIMHYLHSNHIFTSSSSSHRHCTTTTTTTRHTNNNQHTTRVRNVIDLGSGTGRVVLAAALALQHWYDHNYHHHHQQQEQPTTMVMGYEIVPELHNMAVQRLVPIWNSEQQFLSSLTVLASAAAVASSDQSTCGRSWNQTLLDLQCGDFIQHAESWIQTVDLIFIHGTVFEDELWEQLYHIVVGTNTTNATAKNNRGRGAKIGTVIVSVSRLLSLLPCGVVQQQQQQQQQKQQQQQLQQPPPEILYLKCISELFVEMSWGRGIVYIQQVAELQVEEETS